MLLSNLFTLMPRTFALLLCTFQMSSIWASSLQITSINAKTIEDIVASAKQNFKFECQLKVPNPRRDPAWTPNEDIYLSIPVQVKAQKMPEFSHEMIVTSINASFQLNQIYKDNESNQQFATVQNLKEQKIFTWSSSKGNGQLAFTHPSIRLYPKGEAKLMGAAQMQLEDFEFTGNQQLAQCELIQ